MSLVRVAGITVMVFAVVALMATAVVACLGHHVPGEFPACAMVLLMVGLTLVKPSLIMSKDDPDQLSAMRIAVLLIVGVFTLLTVKGSWNCASPAALTLDHGWAWVVIAALGGKAAQSFSETLGSSSAAPDAHARSTLPAQTKIDLTNGPTRKPGDP